MGSIRRFANQLSGKLRRLQISVVLIVSSFVVKAFLFILLAAGFVSSALPPCSNAKHPFFWDSAGYTYYLCDSIVNSQQMLTARTLVASPLVIPLIAMITDPIIIMYVLFIVNHHVHELFQLFAPAFHNHPDFKPLSSSN
jgi:hypothetical protein